MNPPPDEKLPRRLIVWGIATLGGELALFAITGFLIVFLYRSGTWTRAQVNLWGPILIFVDALVGGAVSLTTLRWLVLPKIAPRQGEQSATRDQ